MEEILRLREEVQAREPSLAPPGQLGGPSATDFRRALTQQAAGVTGPPGPSEPASPSSPAAGADAPAPHQDVRPEQVAQLLEASHRIERGAQILDRLGLWEEAEEARGLAMRLRLRARSGGLPPGVAAGAGLR